MERSPSAQSPDVKESQPSFRKPAIEASRRNYRRHSPTSSRSRSPSPGSGKWDRSPSHHHEGGIFSKGRNYDADDGKGREDGRIRRAADVSLGYGNHSRDRHGRAEGHDHNLSRRYSSHHDRTYQNSRSDHSRYDDGRYAKRTADRSTRERNADDSGYRRRDERDRDERMSDARVSDRDKVREYETDVRDKFNGKDREIRRGQDRYAEKHRDDGPDIDAQQSRLAKRINSGTGQRDIETLEGRDLDTEMRDGREGPKVNKADIEKSRDKETERRGRDDGRELESDKGEFDGRRNKDKSHKVRDEHHRGKKGYSSDEHEDADELSRENSHNHSHSRKEDKDKKYSSEKRRSKQEGHDVVRTSDYSDENRRSDDRSKGSKWGPEADFPDSMAASSDPEMAKMAAMKAAALVNINLGGFKSVDEKRKMLWGSKEQKPAVASGTNQWDTVQFADRDRQEKFNKLMGVKGDAMDGQKNTNNSFTTQKQEELQQDLEKQFTAGLRRRDGRTVGLGL